MEYEIVPRQNLAAMTDVVVEDCITLDDEFGETEMVFRNKHGSYYTSTTLRSYFNESIVKIDPIERVEYRNPFLCEAPKTNKLSLIEELIMGTSQHTDHIFREYLTPERRRLVVVREGESDIIRRVVEIFQKVRGRRESVFV